MNVTNELITQWEPKAYKMANSVSIRGVDREEIVQELRLAIAYAARHFREDAGASFHTYLHYAMVSTIRNMISKAQKTEVTFPIEAFSNTVSGKGSIENMGVALYGLELTSGERIVLDLLLCGYNVTQIANLSVSPYRARKAYKSLREKASIFFDVPLEE